MRKLAIFICRVNNVSCQHIQTAAWVAGCDGARSAVGELSAIAFPGAPYEHVFFVADAEVTGSMVPDEVNVYLWRQGFHLFFPMRGKDHWRIVGILPASLRGRDDVNFEAVIPQSSFYLMRPDGHVGLCGARLQSSRVARYVFETVRLKAFGT